MTQNLLDSVDVLDPVWSSPYQHSVTMLTKFTPKNKNNNHSNTNNKGNNNCSRRSNSKNCHNMPIIIN